MEAEFMSREQLAQWLQLPVRWLNDNAHEGPPYYKLNNRTVRYRVSEVETWLRVRRT